MRLLRLLALILPCGIAMPVVAQRRGDDPVAKLERNRTANPSSVAALRALGVAYYKRQRFAEAGTVLNAARRLDPRTA